MEALTQKIENQITEPYIYDYLNYRNFLSDMIRFLRSVGKFSERTFAKRAGFRSSSHVRMVTGGKRNLSTEGALKIARGLELTAWDARFFLALVEFAQSTNPTDQEEAYKKILTFKRFQRAHETRGAEYQYFSHWYTVAILEALGIAGWGARSFEDMAKELNISEAKIRDSFELLQTLNLVELKEGAWIRKHDALQTPSETESVHLRSFHKQMTLKALEAIDNLPSDQRKLMGLTISLDDEGYRELTAAMFEKIKELNVKFTDCKNPKAVFHFGLQIFPLVEIR